MDKRNNLSEQCEEMQLQITVIAQNIVVASMFLQGLVATCFQQTFHIFSTEVRFKWTMWVDVGKILAE